MNQSNKRNVIAGLYGNALEWFDFLLYASFAPIFSDIFFPSHSEFISLMTTFTVFAMGFLVRPVGGFLLGHYGDHVGRRKALILSISIMTSATFCIAFLPTIQQIGLAAPLLLTFLRLMQGLAVGGELPSSATFLIEHTDAKRRGLVGSLVLSTAFLGIFAGSFIAGMSTEFFSKEAMFSYGWRVPYFFGGIMGLIGLYLRIYSSDPRKFLQIKKREALPIKLVFTIYKNKLLLAIFFTSVMALGNYILIAYVTTFLVKMENFLLRDALIINFSALLLLTLLIPIMGFLSDLVGRKPIFLSGLIGLLIFTLPLFWLLTTKNFVSVLLAELMLAVILAPLNATVPTLLAEMFPTTVRASGTAVGYNIGQALFGGTVPLVSFALIELTGNKFAPAWYVILWAFIVFFSTFFAKETYQDRLI